MIPLYIANLRTENQHMFTVYERIEKHNDASSSHACFQLFVKLTLNALIKSQIDGGVPMQGYERKRHDLHGIELIS